MRLGNLSDNQNHVAVSNAGRTFNLFTQNAAEIPNHSRFAGCNVAVSSPPPVYNSFTSGNWLDPQCYSAPHRQRTTNAHRRPLPNRLAQMHPYSKVKTYQGINQDITSSTSIFRILGNNKPAEAQRIFTPLNQRLKLTPINIAIASACALMEQVQYQEAEKVVLNVRKNPSDSTIPSGFERLDITLAIIWNRMKQYKEAEKLLLATIDKTPDMLEVELSVPSGRDKIDQTLTLLWREMGRVELAHELWLNIKPSVTRRQPISRHTQSLQLSPVSR